MLPELQVYDHGLSPLPVEIPFSKLVLGVKLVFVDRFSEFLLRIMTNLVPNIVENIFCLPPKLNINYLRKFSLEPKSTH